MNGREVEWNEKQLKLAWVRPDCPDPDVGRRLWPQSAGGRRPGLRRRDRRLADPVIIKWIVDTAREAAAEAGRDPATIKSIVAPSHITDVFADEETRCAGSRR